MQADRGPTALQSLVRVREVARKRAQQHLAAANAESTAAQASVGAAQAALEDLDRQPPAQPPARVTAGALRRQGATLRAHQSRRAELRAALAKAHCDAATANARLLEARDALARADAEFGAAQRRQQGQQQAGQRRRRAAEDDAIDDLAAVRSRRQR